MTLMQWLHRVTLVLVGCAGLLGAVRAQTWPGPRTIRLSSALVAAPSSATRCATSTRWSSRPPPSRNFDLGAGCGATCNRRCSSKASSRASGMKRRATRALELYRNYVNELAAGFQAHCTIPPGPGGGQVDQFPASFSSSKKGPRQERAFRIRDVMRPRANTIRTGTFQRKT